MGAEHRIRLLTVHHRLCLDTPMSYHGKLQLTFEPRRKVREAHTPTCPTAVAAAPDFRFSAVGSAQ